MPASKKMTEIRALIRRLELKPHPEGGWYRETYRSAASTAILFLLPEGERSRLHRIRADELWHFHLGGPLTVGEIGPDGRPRETVLGPDLSKGQRVQHAVPAGRWFGAWPRRGSGFALVGCTVAPPFRFADFELARRDDALREFRGARRLIERLTD